MNASDRAVRYTPDDVWAVWFAIQIHHAAARGPLPVEQLVENYVPEHTYRHPGYDVFPAPDVKPLLCYVGYDEWTPPSPTIELYRRGADILASEVRLVSVWMDFMDEFQLWKREVRVVESPVVSWQTGWINLDPVMTAHALRSKGLNSAFQADRAEQERVNPVDMKTRTEYFAFVMETIGDPRADDFRKKRICKLQKSLADAEMLARVWSNVGYKTVYIHGIESHVTHVGCVAGRRHDHEFNTGISYQRGRRRVEEDWFDPYDV